MQISSDDLETFDYAGMIIDVANPEKKIKGVGNVVNFVDKKIEKKIKEALKKISTKKAPKEIDRIDKPNTNIPYSQYHVHEKKTDASYNLD
jgi:hypothetical protein